MGQVIIYPRSESYYKRYTKYYKIFFKNDFIFFIEDKALDNNYNFVFGFNRFVGSYLVEFKKERAGSKKR